MNGAGPWVAAARAQADDGIHRTAVDTGGFRFGHVLDIHDVNFLPGGAKYGDLPGFIALGGSANIFVAGEESRTEKAGAVTTSVRGKGTTDKSAVDWLLELPPN